MHVVVVNLFGEIGRSNWTGVQIESDKGQRALMHAAIRTNEFTLAKTHVHVIRERSGFPSGGVCFGFGH